MCLVALAGSSLLVSACGAKTFYSRSQPTSRDIGCSDTSEQPVAVVQGITSGEYGWVCGRPPSCRGGQEVVWARTGATRDYDSANQYVVEGKCVPKCGDGEERAPNGTCLATGVQDDPATKQLKACVSRCMLDPDAGCGAAGAMSNIGRWVDHGGGHLCCQNACAQGSYKSCDGCDLPGFEAKENQCREETRDGTSAQQECLSRVRRAHKKCTDLGCYQ